MHACFEKKRKPSSENRRAKRKDKVKVHDLARKPRLAHKQDNRRDAQRFIAMRIPFRVAKKLFFRNIFAPFRHTDC